MAKEACLQRKVWHVFRTWPANTQLASCVLLSGYLLRASRILPERRHADQVAREIRNDGEIVVAQVGKVNAAVVHSRVMLRHVLCMGLVRAGMCKDSRRATRGYHSSRHKRDIGKHSATMHIPKGSDIEGFLSIEAGPAIDQGNHRHRAWSILSIMLV